MFSNKISSSKFNCRRFENVNIHDPYLCTLLVPKKYLFDDSRMYSIIQKSLSVKISSIQI